MIKIAEEVISLYPLTSPVIEFIRHNENMTFKVKESFLFATLIVMTGSKSMQPKFAIR
ncbi:hypothetical protein [Cohnella abietis]|uniref:Uncharacterized protein n=1 Tax=Cohnella abietis TaxID=2507935 RepID=A0A3T1DET2_9BACL|nr:hypothetical protein [Cohnella abietis]BBI36478.1 hypothetical protein KCTCHS21_58770 [Cohnella abietis]